MNVAKELARLEKLTVAELRREYETVFREQCRSNHKQWFVKRIIWRLQANAEGGLSERARRRAMELANDSDLRLMPPKEPKTPTRATSPALRVVRDKAAKSDRRLPAPGSTITRNYKSRQLRVTVLDDGLEFEGERYPTLSAVAKAVTGSHTNGFLFFKLGKYAGGRR
jgi:hypothetical protein